MSISDSEAVKRQYRTADNLNTRISIHEKYSKNKTGFGNWIVSHYDIRPCSRVLELGCGTGDMWVSHLDMLNNGSELILSDFSDGMLAAARANLGQPANVTFEQINIENIPYPDGRFDVVIANMMLYHVPDIHRALSEVRRVLRDDGIFYCATYGENGIIQFIGELLKEHGVRDITNKAFTLQNGAAILGGYFTDISRLDYDDCLLVTDINDMIDYIASCASITGLGAVSRETMRETLVSKMENGVLTVPKEYGMFVCRK